MGNRTKIDILVDLRKAYERGAMLRIIGPGWTMRQRIEHHKFMAEFLQEFLEVGGKVEELMMIER